MFLVTCPILNNQSITKSNAIQLDIHLPLIANKTSCIYELVTEANSQLNQFSVSHHTNEQINFNYDSDHNDLNNTTTQIPHVTLFLTDFDLGDDKSKAQANKMSNDKQKMNQNLLKEFIKTLQTSICREMKKQRDDAYYYNIEISAPIIRSFYAMYETKVTENIQHLSDVIVNTTQRFVKEDQPVPDWVYRIKDEQTKLKKIRYIKMYGSPNVLDEFDPHVTTGYDDGGKGNQSEKDIEDFRFTILNSLRWKSCDGWIGEIRVGLVGDYGTVIGKPIAIVYLRDCERIDDIAVQL